MGWVIGCISYDEMRRGICSAIDCANIKYITKRGVEEVVN